MRSKKTSKADRRAPLPQIAIEQITQWLRRVPASRLSLIGHAVVKVFDAATDKDVDHLKAIASQSGGMIRQMARAAIVGVEQDDVVAASEPAWVALRWMHMKALSSQADILAFLESLRSGRAGDAVKSDEDQGDRRAHIARIGEQLAAIVEHPLTPRVISDAIEEAVVDITNNVDLPYDAEYIRYVWQGVVRQFAGEEG
jgi:hypothetical protein